MNYGKKLIRMKIVNKAIIKIEYNDEIREYVFDINELNNIIKEKQARIDKAIELLERYNDRENNYYVPVMETIDILKGSDK